jgi:hypothetical protein
MAASLVRSSARVAPRSVIRVAAISLMISSTVEAEDCTAPVQDNVADRAVANDLWKVVAGIHMQDGEWNCRRVKRLLGKPQHDE